MDLGNKGKGAIMLGANTMLFKNWPEDSYDIELEINIDKIQLFRTDNGNSVF